MKEEKKSSVSVRELLAKEPEPVSWVVDDLIPTGLGLIIGPSKLGKSWMALQLALAVAGGSEFLGFHARKGNVLYLALEDSERRLVERVGHIQKLEEVPEGFRVKFMSSRLPKLMDELEEERRFSNPKLIIIDTLQMIRGPVRGNENLYAYDYREMSMLKRFADENNIAIIAIHHTRKMNDASNVFNNINGTTGIMGAADSSYVLSKDKGKVMLSITGRDISSEEYLLSFDKDTCLWSMEETREAETQRRLLKSFESSPVVRMLRNAELPYKATASELQQEIKDKEGACLSLSEVSGTIQKYERLLNERLHIVHHTERTSSRRLHVFERKGESIDGR